MKDKIVTLKTFSSPIEARVVKSMLESNGISCLITNENFAGVFPIYDAEAGGVKLKVFERELERALALLEGND